MSAKDIHIGDAACNTLALRHSAQAPLSATFPRLRQMVVEYIRQRAFRRAEKELMGLDDRMLRDIGLDRSEIGSAVRNPAQERLVSSEVCRM